MHPRNRHQGRYDLARLARVHPPLAAFVARNPLSREPSVDFSDERAVRALNAALLKDDYGLEHWDIPAGCLCPPVPGRADHIHHAADLIGAKRGARVLDVGVGANCVYPIIGRGEYGWDFVGTDVDPAALRCAGAIVKANPLLAGHVELRRQTPPAVLRGVILPGESFDLTVCNPPFNATRAEADAGTKRKWENLRRSAKTGRNFGGRAAELWCPGGEARFARTLIEESRAYAGQVGWFSILLSKAETADASRTHLNRAKVAASRVVEMAQGNKKSRLLAWTYRA